MYILYLDNSDGYDWHEFNVIVASHSKEKVEQYRQDLLNCAAQERESINFRSEEIRSWCRTQCEKVREFMNQNRDAIRHLNKPTTIHKRKLDPNAFAVGVIGAEPIKITIPKDWHGTDGSPYPNFLKKQAQDVVIDMAVSHWEEFKKEDGYLKYLYPEKMVTQKLWIQDIMPPYITSQYSAYSEDSLKITEVEEI